VDREVRNLQHTKQKSTPVKPVTHVDKNELTEGVPKPVYIKGYGLRLVVKYNNELWYFSGSTTLS